MSANPEVGGEQSFVAHLMELRDRLLRIVLAVLAVLLLLFPFSNDLYTFVAGPLLAVMPKGTSMIATQVASPFLTPFKLTLVAAVVLAMPFILYQLWAFVAPGLYRHERRLALPLLVSSIALFYLGMAFAYYVVFPLVFAFFTGTAPDGVAVTPDISAYLDFVLTLFMAFGIAFEIPIATILLVKVGFTTPQQLASKRPYIVVVAFVVGMLLTPPDMISQTLLAVPMWLLFEAGVFFSRMAVKRPEDEEPEAAAETGDDGQPGPAPAGAAPEAEDAEYRPMSEEEMDAELDRMEEEDRDLPEDDQEVDDLPAVNPVDETLRRANELRQAMDFEGARRLLYEVLVEGDASQVQVARDILKQLDEDA